MFWGNNTSIKKKCFIYTKKKEIRESYSRKMLKVNSINNVKYTLNKPLSFTAGVQTNYGIEAPAPEENMVEGGLFTGFVGTIAPFFAQINSRAKSIEKGIEKTKLDLMA